MEIAKSQKKRPWPVLALSVLSLIGLISLILTISPDFVFSIFFIKLSSVFLFFPLLFLCCYGLGAFFLKNAVQGILIASLISLFLFFRLVNLTSPLFLVLLLILFASLEAVVWKKEI